jgi:hypothetical protein
MDALGEFFTDDFFEEICAAVYFLMGVTQGTAYAFVRAGDTDGLTADKVIAERIKKSPPGIEPSEHLFPVPLGQLVLHAVILYQPHYSPGLHKD